MLKKSQFLRNWNPFSVVIGGCSAILSTKNCSLKDALQLGQTRFLPRAFKNCLGFKPVVKGTITKSHAAWPAIRLLLQSCVGKSSKMSRILIFTFWSRWAFSFLVFERNVEKKCRKCETFRAFSDTLRTYFVCLTY